MIAAGLLFWTQQVPYPAHALETWEKIDKRLKAQVYQVNVGIKMHVKGGHFAHLADLSPKYKFPVFSTTPDDKGFRVVGSGSCFPIKTARLDRTYFLTNRHVVDSDENLIREFERFFAALNLYAKNSAGFADPAQRYKDIVNIINNGQKKDLNFAEKAIYQSTVDSIWDTYENHLSLRADPQRKEFKKYLELAGVNHETGYFLHAAGPVSQESIPASLFKVARSENEPDLAVLVSTNKNLVKLEFDPVPPTEGQEIQVIGYPLASDQIDFDSSAYYSPTFSTGRISRVAPKILQVDAPVSVGNSGGPVISQRGKVLGVVVRRASYQQKLGNQTIQTELPNFAAAITINMVKAFAHELFQAP